MGDLVGVAVEDTGEIRVGPSCKGLVHVPRKLTPLVRPVHVAVHVVVLCQSVVICQDRVSSHVVDHLWQIDVIEQISGAVFIRSLGTSKKWAVYAQTCIDEGIDGATLTDATADTLSTHYGFSVIHANRVVAEVQRKKQGGAANAPQGTPLLALTACFLSAYPVSAFVFLFFPQHSHHHRPPPHHPLP